MKIATRIQLSFMIFFNFFIWSGWFVTPGFIAMFLSLVFFENEKTESVTGLQAEKGLTSTQLI